MKMTCEEFINANHICELDDITNKDKEKYMKNNKQNNNVFHFGQERNIFRKIALFFKRIKWAWQRATKGYSDWDLWDLDCYYNNLFIMSLREFAEYVRGYPISVENCDLWREIVNHMADCFENREENTEQIDAILNKMKDTAPESPERQALREEYQEAYRKEAERCVQANDEAFELMKKYIWCLWW